MELIGEQHSQRWTPVKIFSISVMKSFLTGYLGLYPFYSWNIIKKQKGILKTRPGQQKYITDLIRTVCGDQLAFNLFGKSVLFSCTMESSHFFKQFRVCFLVFNTLTSILTNMPISSSHLSYSTYEHLLECWEHRQIYREANVVYVLRPITGRGRSNVFPWSCAIAKFTKVRYFSTILLRNPPQIINALDTIKPGSPSGQETVNEHSPSMHKCLMPWRPFPSKPYRGQVKPQRTFFFCLLVSFF